MKFQDLLSCEKSIKLRFLEKMSVEKENFILREKKKFDEKSIEQIWTTGIIKDEFSAFQPILQLKPKVFLFHAISIAIMFNLNMFLAIIAPIFVFALGRLIINKLKMSNTKYMHIFSLQYIFCILTQPGVTLRKLSKHGLYMARNAISSRDFLTKNL